MLGAGSMLGASERASQQMGWHNHLETIGFYIRILLPIIDRQPQLNRDQPLA